MYTMSKCQKIMLKMSNMSKKKLNVMLRMVNNLRFDYPPEAENSLQIQK